MVKLIDCLLVLEFARRFVTVSISYSFLLPSCLCTLMTIMCRLRFVCLLLFIFRSLVSSEELPTLQSGPDADLYWSHRDQILVEESRISLGGQLNFEYGEREANDVLMAAKWAEIDRGFRDPSSFLPARNFLSVADEIRRSPTFRIIQAMPKGAALHVHSKAFVSTDFVFGNITFRDNLYICRPPDGSFQFEFRRSGGSEVTCASSNGWELLAELRANASIVKDVNTRIRDAMIVPDPATAYCNINVSWTAFRNVSKTIRSLLVYKPVLEDYVYQGLTELYRDNVFYIELRITFQNLYDLDGNVYGPLDIVRLYKNTTDRFIRDHPDFVGARLIFAPRRSDSEAKEQIKQYFVTFAAVQKAFPDFVVGFDIVGQEDTGHPLTWLLKELRTIAPSTRFFFHAGETNWNGLSTDGNLIDAVLLNTTRIGHGFAVSKHPRVLELVVEREVAIELNPISNQVLCFCGDMRNHPASFLFARNYPVVVSSDDPAIWGASGLSYDFYEAFVGIMSRSADIRALKQLAINSIKYSAMPNEEKNRAYAIWQDKWAKFITDLGQRSGAPIITHT
ncbi:adenosine deaminase 2-like isoform X1 [Neodiprion pinetum]|uniref:adenosine deaminase 2-like isoform X1 n=2 Tax=Neodiprion pinetum TaxID=441929 RepID=UPI001EDCE814|nr:adenosine deaminase 2-like isoform X1 [Neodiprion pinetum]